MKRAKWALLLALAAISTSPTLIQAQESVEPPAERVAAFEEASYVLRPRLTAEGALVGDIGTMVGGSTVRTIPNLPVSLVSQGKIVARVMTNTEGEFSFPQVAPGGYTIVASNPKILHVAWMVVGPYADGESSAVHLIAASPLSAERRKAMMVGFVGQVSQAAAFQSAPVFEPIVTTYRVMISAEGTVNGMAKAEGVDMTGLVVRAFREGAPVGQAEVAADGSFVLTNMTPGPLSVVAFGPQGMAAFAVELVVEQPIARNIEGAQVLSNESTVSAVAPAVASDELVFELPPPSDVQAGASVPGDSFSAPGEDIFAGGDASMSGGANYSTGGGGGGGGGGVGAIGALGAAAAAIAAGNGGGFVPTASTDGGGT